jgi:hypothetical protein
MWFDVEEAGLEFCEKSPYRIENEAVLAAPPERAFDIIVNGREQGRWFADFVACRWTSPEPYGLGSTREIELKLLTVKEKFIAWERGKRLSFTFTGMTLPVVKRMVEDLRLSPIGPNKTRLVWTAHYEPRAFMRPFHGIARGVFGKLFSKSAEGLARYSSELAASS